MDRAFPTWCRELNDAWARGTAAIETEPNPLATVTSSRDPALAFVSIVGPFVADVIRELTAEATRLTRTHKRTPFVPLPVAQALAGSLINRLADLVRRTGVLEMNAARLSGDLTGATSTERFYSFTRRAADPGVAAAILRRSPVLARLAFTITSTWLHASREFLARLSDDWSELRAEFGLADGDKVIEIVPKGDFHLGGRTVLALRFASERRLVYKPRTVDVEASFQRLLEWICSQPGVPDLYRLIVITKRTHGWVEYVEPRPCPSDEVSILYRRYGALLSVLHALASGDCHFENIVASGSSPVVVDLEAVFHAFPAADLEQISLAEQATLELTGNSVLTVGLLPLRAWSNASRRSVDISGLGAREDEWAGAVAPQWENEHTDEMREVLRERRPRERTRTSEEREQDALLTYTQDIADGFAATYRVLLARRDDLLRGDGPLAALSHVETRSILRTTGQYAFLLQSVSHPSFLDDGAKVDERFDRLLAIANGEAADAPVIESERADMWRMDVPIFRTYPATKDISGSDGRWIPDFLAETGLVRARRRIASMSESDLEHQRWLIQLSIATWALNRLDVSEAEKKSPLPLRPKPSADPIAFADALANRLQQLAIRRGGEATWIGTHYRSEDETWVVDGLSPSLFDGLAGILLFLAYVAHATGRPQHSELARETLRAFERQLDRAAGAPVPAPAGVSGVGGWIHALTHLGVLWDDDRLLRRAAALVPTLQKALELPSTVDVLGGAAGAIRPLLNLYSLTELDEVITCARACGENVVAAAEPQAVGVGWPSPAGPRPLTGFAHGAAGICWALLKLYEVTRDDRLRRTAVAGIAYERSLFSTRDESWRDLRWAEATDDIQAAPCAYYWCHGSAGIGLSRLDTLAVYRDDRTCGEIESAIRATAGHGFRADHSLCHGFASAAELMMAAAVAGIPSPPPPMGSSWGDAMLESIRQNGCCTGCPLGVEVPGLMMGVAGIGYGLLRLANARRFPSVLLLEPPQIS